MVACLAQGNNPFPTIGRMKRHAAIAILFLLFLPACTMIGHEKVENWPQLTIYEHHVPHHVMRNVCVKYAPWGMSPEACAEFNLAERRCDLWFSADFPPPAFMVRHERMHCEGYDHEGETNMRDFLARYTAEQQRLAEQQRTASAGAGATSPR
jgi:hypothetical protein